MAAKGFSKLLGRPRLDPLTVLVRETAQNSWDARCSDDETVRFGIVGRRFTPDQVSCLRNRVFPEAERIDGLAIAPCLDGGQSTGLHVFDRGTKGLGGPTRADHVDPEGLYDWVDFVLNVGKENTAEKAGGTYGFGKTISYIVSQASAIVIHTHTRHLGRSESRLIACAIGDGFEHEGRLFTGRHWWGRRSEDTPEPILNDDADEIAKLLGMPPFTVGQSGTSILIVAPGFNGRTGPQAMRFIAESAAWHLWPKLLERGLHRPMSIRVAWEGEEIPVPRPEERPPLQAFADAFRVLNGQVDAKSVPGARLDTVRCLRPRADTGDLVTLAVAKRPRREPDVGCDPGSEDSPPAAASITGTSHHVAFLRSPELVVEYYQGPPPPEEGMEWAGVFRCRTEHDHTFAQAEPPTHDSWNADLLPKGRERTIVNVTLRRIDAILKDLWTAPSPADDAPNLPVARVAEMLAPLAGAVSTGTGIGVAREAATAIRQQRPRPRGGATKATVVGASPVEVGGCVFTDVVVDLSPKPGVDATRLELNASIATRWGSASGLDSHLRLVALFDGHRERMLSGPRDVVTLRGDTRRELTVRVAQGPDTSILLDVTVSDVADGALP